jgi:hypothetical protein
MMMMMMMMMMMIKEVVVQDITEQIKLLKKLRTRCIERDI